MVKYNLVDNGDTANVTAVIDGEMYVASSEQANFDEIVDRLRAGDESVVDLFDYAKAISDKFEDLSERVSVNSGHLFFDGQEMHNTLADQIIRFLKDGLPFDSLVKFYEKIEQNPNEHSREHLYRWLDGHNFTITSEGDILAYKGVRSDLTSIHSGPAVVDGKAVNGNVPNAIGSVVTMDRSKVTFDPGTGCSVGLHVGTYNYASSFAQGNLLEVVVNPRDVVSVPTDCGDEKMRVSRYRILDVIEQEHQAPLFDEYEDDFDEDDYCECDDCAGPCDDCGYCDCDGLCDDYSY